MLPLTCALFQESSISVCPRKMKETGDPGGADPTKKSSQKS